MILRPLPTLLLRATVDRNARLVLPQWSRSVACYAGFVEPPDGAYRMVQVLTDAPLYFDYSIEDGGRDYDMMRIPREGVIAPFPVMPEQELYAMSEFRPGVNEASLVRASLIVQHWIPVSEVP